MRTDVTAVILTLNEEELIERCIAHLAWAQEVLVIDSESSDATVQRARAAGARVEIVPWQGWSHQRQSAVEMARNDWVFLVDADEIVSKALADEVRRAVASPASETDGFYVDRRNEFLGGLLPNSQRLSARRTMVRLFNRRHSHYDLSVLVHERIEVAGRVHPLRAALVQWRPQTSEQLITRINRYATIEVEELRRKGKRGSLLALVGNPVFRFLWLLVVQGEWRIGRRGVMHAAMRACADCIRQIRLLESELPASTSNNKPEVLRSERAR